MSEEKNTVKCPECGVRLAVPRNMKAVRCPKCQNGFRCDNPADSLAPPSAQSSISSAGADSNQRLGLIGYVLHYFRASRWPIMLWLMLGLLLSVLASPLKPVVGNNGFAVASVSMLALAVLSMGIFVTRRVFEFTFKGQKQLPPDPKSSVSKLAWGGTFVGICLLVMSIAESFSGDKGWLAQVVPPVADLQAQLSLTRSEESVQDAETPVTPDNPTESGSPDEPGKSLELDIRDKPEEDPDSVSSTRQSMNADTTTGNSNKLAQSDEDSSLWSGFGDNEDLADETREQERQIEETPSRVAESESMEVKDDGISKVVIADGVGTNRDEAVRDAFRSAVRQVVGMYVDSETLVENDELVEDQVLTFSNGFVSSWSTIAGSDAYQNGLYRIRIKAAVERKLLVQKLQAVNVTLKSMDGKSMYAKAMTELDAQNDAAKLVKKTLADLPSLLTSEIVGEPSFQKETSEITVQVVTRVDRAAYDTFVQNLESVLAEVAVKKTSTVMSSEQKQIQRAGSVSGSAPEGHIWYHCEDNESLAGPRVESAMQWCVWVNNFNNATHTKLKWNGYVVDFDPREIVNMLEVPIDSGKRVSTAKTMITISAYDSAGGLVTVDEHELLASQHYTYSNSYPMSGKLPFLRVVRPRELEGGKGYVSSLSTPGLDFAKYKRWIDSTQSANLYISPYAFTCKPTNYGKFEYGYYPEWIRERRIEVTLEELAQIDHLKCSISYTPPQKVD